MKPLWIYLALVGVIVVFIPIVVLKNHFSVRYDIEASKPGSNFTFGVSSGIKDDLNIVCGAETKCPSGSECYVFEDTDSPICWTGDPCTRCDSALCRIAESFPPQVFCE